LTTFILSNVNPKHPPHQLVLWYLLRSAQEHTRISNPVLPTWSQHLSFLETHPYFSWWLILDQAPRGYLGAAYQIVSETGATIGIRLFPAFNALFPAVLAQVRSRCKPGSHLMNVSERDQARQDQLSALGAVAIQRTYRLPD
jgi:hypothetical protein